MGEIGFLYRMRINFIVFEYTLT
ncbi:MAG: hypothetical protein HW412_2600, partial [Bacteroidetes bacterium]|nr:hypothetical protein [Bacteroidota bacterium]